MKANINQTLKLYWHYSKRYKFTGLTLVFAVVAQAVVAPITPLYYKKFFDTFGSGLDVSAIGQNLLQILVVVAILGLAERVLFFVMNQSLAKFEIDAMVDLANVCFDKLHRHSFAYFNNNFSGALVKRVNYFVRSFENIVDKLFFQLLPTFITIVFVTTVLLLKS